MGQTEHDNPARHVFRLGVPVYTLNDVANAIYGLGIDDALVGADAAGIYISFDVAGVSLEASIAQAITTVETALPGVRAVLRTE